MRSITKLGRRNFQQSYVLLEGKEARVAVVSVFYGDSFPSWIPLTVLTMQHNPDVDFFIVGNLSYPLSSDESEEKGTSRNKRPRFSSESSRMDDLQH